MARKLPSTWSITDRRISAIRLFLALSALLIIVIDPSEPDRLVAVTYAALALYTIYSASLYLSEALGKPLLSLETAHRVDVASFTTLIALSSGTSSVFFFFYFFSILVASFRWGFTSGLRTTVISSVLFTLVGYATAPSGVEFELNRFLLRPTYLLVLGYMIAYWGGSEITLKRRLTLLNDVTILSNPRFGIDHTIGAVVERLRVFYDADACYLIVADASTGEWRLRRAGRNNPKMATRDEPAPPELARLLLAVPAAHAVVHNDRPRAWWQRDGGRYAFDVARNERISGGWEGGEALAATLDARSFITVPMRYSNSAIGRLYLVTSRPRAYDASEITFLLQIVDHVMPVVENIRLVDRLASDAAEQERQKIARDIHDTVIQPYIGLQIGLSAVLEDLVERDISVATDVERLLEMTHSEITSLRRYIGGLKGSGERGGSLVPALRRFSSKFAEATGIDVSVDAESDVVVSDRLAAEVFQMATEGLSNVRRHTQASRVTIQVACCDGNLSMRIDNDDATGAVPALFTPRSISERATALGGRVRVDPRDGGTAVDVEIPL